MVLVIGKPGSGCTTFLKMLAGMHDEYKSVQGELTLGGRTMAEIIAQNPQDVAFCGMYCTQSSVAHDLTDGMQANRTTISPH